MSGKVDLRINIYRGQVDTNNAIINANDTKNGANGVNCGADLDGKKIVVISDIRFKGKRNINWEEVEQYLKEYIGDCYEVVETSDQVYIGSDFPGELKGSGDTKRLF